jgi:tetratricopeptide (TPR) repeat protein
MLYFSFKEYTQKTIGLSLAFSLITSVAFANTDADQAYSLLTKDPSKASLLFKKALNQEPNNSIWWEQLAYLQFQAGEKDSAITSLREAIKYSPTQDHLWIQLGYWEQTMGRQKLAAQAFWRASQISTSNSGCKAWNAINGLPDRALNRPVYMEVYAAPEYRSHYKVGVLSTEVRLGVTNESEQYDLYLSWKSTRDSQSESASPVAGPVTYFDNASVLGVGARARYEPTLPNMEKGLPITLFIETGRAYDYLNQGRSAWRNDDRYGVIAFQEWGMDYDCSHGAKTSYPLRPNVDFYADYGHYSRYSNDFYSLRLRPGFRIYETSKEAVDAYLLLGDSRSTKQIASNHYIEKGIGIAAKFYSPTRITLRTEWVHVQAPNGSNYGDARIRLEYQARF